VVGLAYADLAIVQPASASGGSTNRGAGPTSLLSLLAGVSTDPTDQLPLQPILTLVRAPA
jgi:hypothetical protein